MHIIRKNSYNNIKYINNFPQQDFFDYSIMHLCTTEKKWDNKMTTNIIIKM